MPHYLIKVEAVNLGATFSLSDNISMFRGASLKLRDAVKQLNDHIDTLTPISIGASIGLFSLDTSDSIASYVNNIKAYLNQEFSTYTFVVNAIQVDKALLSNSSSTYDQAMFYKAKEALITAGRRDQLRQSTMSFKTVKAQEKSEQVCELSHILVADTTMSWQDKNNRPVNSEVKQRFEYGRSSRQKFYTNELKEFEHSQGSGLLSPPNIGFTNDLESLCEQGPVKQLNNKLAYIYLDGNKFSKLQQMSVHSIEEQLAFDKVMQQKRAQLLHDLLHWAAQQHDFKTKDKTKLRLETLLWGGDEMLFVVPAWLGFDVLAKIFELTQDWVFNVQVEQQDKSFPLTHSAGLVFCNKGTPVYRMRVLAQTLADEKKQQAVDRDLALPPEQQPDIPGLVNTFDFLVLESVDYANESLATHFDKIYGKLGATRQASFRQSFDLSQLSTTRNQLTKLAKSQIYALAKTALAATPNQEPANASVFDRQEQRFCQINNISKQQYNQLLDCFGPLLVGQTSEVLEQDITSRGLVWVLLTECWEYLLASEEGE